MYSYCVLPLASQLEFDPLRNEEFFAAIPERPGVFLIEARRTPGRSNAKPYLARSGDLRRAAERLLRPPDRLSKRLNLREVAGTLRFRVTGSRFEQALVLYQHARERFPDRYRSFLRLRPPALLKVNLQNEYPRCYVTRRILDDGGCYAGPFPSRQAAESFAEEFLNLFKIRRCRIKIRRDPNFPGCIYSEMKMCLAPCFGGCGKEEYDAEVGRLLETLVSSGAALTGELERVREDASEGLDFERAAALHKRVEKVSGVFRGLPEIVRRLDELDAAVLQRAAEENAVAVFGVRGGIISDPLVVRFAELSSQPRSVEEILRAELEPRRREPAGGAVSGSRGLAPRSSLLGARMGAEEYRERFGLPRATESLGDHVALLARWFYSNPREGKIFFREPEWPYRRIVRACARLLAAHSSGAESGASSS